MSSEHSVLYLEVGTRTQGDAVTYPEDDLVATFSSDKQWVFTHKDGVEY